MSGRVVGFAAFYVKHLHVKTYILVKLTNPYN